MGLSDPGIKIALGLLSDHLLETINQEPRLNKRRRPRLDCSDDNPQQKASREARRRPAAERQPKTMHDVIEPRRAARPLVEYALVETLGENPPSTMCRFAIKAAHREAQPDFSPCARQVRRQTAIAAVDPARGRLTEGIWRCLPAFVP